MVEPALAGVALIVVNFMPSGLVKIGPVPAVIAAPKVAVAFAKDHDKFVILGGAMGPTALNADSVKSLATMPSLDELRAKLVGLIQAPATKIAGVVQAPAGQLARVIGAYSKKDAA
mgnify:CR=1 FL=1